ncbi:MAG: peptide deformylase [Planctomycetes bacterium]|nr:peptide deformylase [Planctomycetota bacterium]
MIPRNTADLRLVYYPAPILKKRAAPIERIGADVAALAARMFEIMREGKGLGLAAPQVGVGVRLFVCNATGEPQDDVIFVNPRLHDLNGSEEKEEGCLSIPGVNVTMRRPVSAGIDALDVKGRPFSLTGMELLARVWQHEMDHLDGRLIIDNMSATDEIANRRAVKQLRQDYTSAR